MNMFALFPNDSRLIKVSTFARKRLIARDWGIRVPFSNTKTGRVEKGNKAVSGLSAGLRINHGVTLVKFAKIVRTCVTTHHVVRQPSLRGRNFAVGPKLMAYRSSM